MYSDIINKIMHNTVKIETDNSVGTGFFFDFKLSENEIAPTIITNKHVVEDANQVKITISLNEYFDSPDRKVETLTVTIDDVQKDIVYIDDSNVDLCAIYLTQFYNHISKNQIKTTMFKLTMDNIPSVEALEELRFLENVIMVGYPQGLSDIVNNLPLLRSGITSTHPAINHNGEREFLIDMMITPGSSGSPVFVYNPNGFMDKQGKINMQERLMFVGINRALKVQDVYGNIIDLEKPTALISHSQVGINLGIIIKAEVIKDLEKKVLKEHGKY